VIVRVCVLSSLKSADQFEIWTVPRFTVESVPVVVARTTVRSVCSSVVTPGLVKWSVVFASTADAPTLSHATLKVTVSVELGQLEPIAAKQVAGTVPEALSD
jgi:hypothetical protein